MTIQEIKSRIHLLVDEAQDEGLLEEVNRMLSSQSGVDILDELTDDQRTGMEQARHEARQGQGMPVADFKRKLEEKWPQLKSL